MPAYYNEHDKFAAQWLRNLIAAGHIAAGDVDERSIEDVRPDDLRGYTQCHFFAGIGVWSSALRLAGWPDDRPVWTGSCPCQPFSAAGKGLGFDDERHLWPAWHHLISECRPPVILGEQVASKDVDPWIDLVFDDLEALEYACAANPFPSAGVGAPHIRDRTFFVAHAHDARSQGRRGVRERSVELAARARRVAGIVADAERRPAERQRLDVGSAASGMRSSSREQRVRDDAGHGGNSGRLADADIIARGQGSPIDGGWNPRSDAQPRAGLGGSSLPGELADTVRTGSLSSTHAGVHRGEESTGPRHGESERRGAVGERAGPTNGFWRAADWLLCRDGKWRPVESQPQPLVDGSAESLGLVRADIIAALTEELNATAMEAKVIGAQAMRDVFEALGTEAQRCWPTRGLPGLHEAPFLLAFVRQLASQRWIFAQGIPLPRPEVAGQSLRGVRDDETAASASRRRELDEQHAGERPDIVRLLSCILARHAQAAWGEAYKTYAAIGFPLSTGEPARVGRLRAYGNAINREAAAAFISAADEAMTTTYSE